MYEWLGFETSVPVLRKEFLGHFNVVITNYNHISNIKMTIIITVIITFVITIIAIKSTIIITFSNKYKWVSNESKMLQNVANSIVNNYNFNYNHTNFYKSSYNICQIITMIIKS